MCRSIKTLRGTPATENEFRAAALQFVRKVSGYRQPSKANEATFDAAVEEIAAASKRLLGGLIHRAQPGEAPGRAPPAQKGESAWPSSTTRSP